MINFILPGFFLKFNLNKKLLQYYKDYPEYFYDNINFYAIYDSFPWNIFSGGREPQESLHATIEDIYKILITFNHLEIRQVCTNSLIKEKNLQNRFANICLKICEDTTNAIIINNDLLLNYIKQTYPKYHFISSTTKCILDHTLLLNEINNPNYNMVCLDYNLNHNFSFLNKLTQEQKNKCEFLVNPICPPNCQERKQHYQQISNSFLTFYPYSKLHTCNIKNNYLTLKFWEQSTIISPHEIFEIYEPNGFHYFKLEGRTIPNDTLLNIYCTYFIKPKHQQHIINLFKINNF